MTQISGVPAAYVETLRIVSYQKGIPQSWLAGVCEMTQWNPNFQVINYAGNRNTVRQLGIAGIWCDIPEIMVHLGNCGWSRGNVPAGWHAPTIEDVYFCACKPLPPTDVLGNMSMAADILKDSAQAVTQICGALNSLAFLRWQLGCGWLPSKDADGKCIVTPDIPDLFLRNVNDYWSFQIQYAQVFNEPPIGLPLAVTLTASATSINPGDTVTFQAHTQGGQPPYSWVFDFGEGQLITSTMPTAQHTYTVEGTYNAKVTARDNLGIIAESPVFNIGVGVPGSGGGGGGGGNGLLMVGLIGLLGLVGLAGLAGSSPQSKRSQSGRY